MTREQLLDEAKRIVKLIGKVSTERRRTTLL